MILSQDKDLFEKMAKYFVPVDTMLRGIVPIHHNKIFTSLILRGFAQIKIPHGPYKTEYQKYRWNSPILITKLGIAYITGKYGSHRPSFSYWDELTIGKKLHVKDHTYSLLKELRGLYTEKDFLVIKKNFSAFCLMLKNKFLNLIKELNKCAKNIESTRETIAKYGIYDFIANLEILISKINKEVQEKLILKGRLTVDGLSKKHLTSIGKALDRPLKILDNAITIAEGNNKKILLHYYAKLLVDLKKYSEAYDCYINILEIDPSDVLAKENSKNLKNLANSQNITGKVRKQAEKLYQKSIKERLKDKEKSLNFCIEAYNLNPYEPKIKKHLIRMLILSGKEEEIKNYINDTL